uniref:Tetraspanin n=1 Tax=Globodera rostochiensis TaxID=31243 RepID=A0A914HVZ8_GLORO
MTPSAGDYRMFVGMNDESTRSSDCRLWSKYAIYAANIVFMVVGTLVLATGAWLRTDSRFRDFLSERYRQAVHEAFWEAPTLYTFSYILILLGAALLLVAMCGCCGVTTNGRRRQRRGTTAASGGDINSPLLWLYAVGTAVLLMFTIGCGSYILYTKDGIDVELSDALNYMVQHYYQGPGIVQESLDRLQQAFRCCGNAGCSDFRAFRQDPPRTCDLRCDGCHYRIWLALRIGFSVALAIFGVVILAQMIAISVSITLLCTPDEDDDAAYGDDVNYDNFYRFYGFGGGAAADQQHHHHNQQRMIAARRRQGDVGGVHGGGGEGSAAAAVRSLERAKAHYQRQMAAFGGHPTTPSAETLANLYTTGGGTYSSRQHWQHGPAAQRQQQQRKTNHQHYQLRNPSYYY